MLALAVGGFSTAEARAAECASPAGLSACFDANALWLPAGSTSFMTLPDTRVTAVRRPSVGFSSELLHRPVQLHAASPDTGGRDVHVLELALDASLFAAFGLARDLELNVVSPYRVYQSGAGVAGVTSQAGAEVTHTALRDPRIGFAYSLDETLHTSGLGMRLELDASIPLGDEPAFYGERSFVVLPRVTFGLRRSVLRASASFGARLRRAVDFGGVRLGNQAVLALGVGVEVLAPDLLFVAVEAFASPPLADNRAPSAGPEVTEVNLFPAEWLATVHSSFGTAHWSLGLGAGSGLPLSSETRSTPYGPSTAHFLGATTPDFRSLLVLRYTLSAPF